MTIRLKTEEQIKVFCADDIYGIMQRVLMRENKTDRNREHLWIVSLDSANKILNIELVSMGSVNKTIVEPMEVFSVPLQKRALKIVIIHNHPSGELQPSEADKDITDRLIQCGLIMNVHVLDHLIISEKACYSFAESGLLKELEMSSKYVPDFKIKERLRKEIEEKALQTGEGRKAREMARVMLQDNVEIGLIVKYTGLSKAAIKGIII